MEKQQKIMWWKKREAVQRGKKAVAYYRHSAQDRQENSIEIQQDQVRAFAAKNGIQIIKEFMDRGKSGLSTEGRKGFQDMMNKYVKNDMIEFKYVLVLDVSRWGRYQDTDEAAYLSFKCTKHQKEVVYVNMGFIDEKDREYASFRMYMERVGAGKTSATLSQKVFLGCVKISQQGYKAGGTPPFGFNRQLLDEKRNLVQILIPGQRKSIQNQRVTLTPGERKEVMTIKIIFRAFVRQGRTPREIADLLNAKNISAPRKTSWTPGKISRILTNEFYAGTMVYNKTSQKLKSPQVHNPSEQWIRREEAFPGIVDKKTYDKAQEIILTRQKEFEKLYSEEDMLIKLKSMRDRFGVVTGNMIAATKDMAPKAAYLKRFLSLDMSHQRLYGAVHEDIRRTVIEQLKSQICQVEQVDDYVVLNERISVLIQPSVPISRGYEVYWPFRPDPRTDVDITLGVPLSDNAEHEILGYLLLPRVMIDQPSFRLCSSNIDKLDFFGFGDLEIIKKLLE